LGAKFERLLRDSIKKNPVNADCISNAIYGKKGLFKNIYVVGGNNEKSDVIIEYDYSNIIGINLKSGQTDLNQVMRLWANELSVVGVSTAVISIIDNCLLDAALKKGFIMRPIDQSTVKSNFAANLKKVMEYIFTRNNSSVNVWGITDLTVKPVKTYLYKMDEVIKFLSAQTITFSKNGVMNIGNYLTMKRKGGDGGSSVSKTISGKPNPKHPGNQLQFQMKILSFVKDTIKYPTTHPKPFLII